MEYNCLKNRSGVGILTTVLPSSLLSLLLCLFCYHPTSPSPWLPHWPSPGSPHFPAGEHSPTHPHLLTIYNSSKLLTYSAVPHHLKIYPPSCANTGGLQHFDLHSQCTELLRFRTCRAVSHLWTSTLAGPSAGLVLLQVHLMNSYSPLNTQPKGHLLWEAFHYLSMLESLYPTRVCLLIICHTQWLVLVNMFISPGKL